jgi:hypothetical protein
MRPKRRSDVPRAQHRDALAPRLRGRFVVAQTIANHRQIIEVVGPLRIGLGHSAGAHRDNLFLDGARFLEFALLEMAEHERGTQVEDRRVGAARLPGRALFDAGELLFSHRDRVVVTLGLQERIQCGLREA